MNTPADNGRNIGSARCGIYAFYDYDDEPIYVGQTYESLRVRIGRHLTNQRTDAVAMRVLDPMEVAKVEVWPFWGLEAQEPTDQHNTLNRAESTVYQALAARATVSKLLNELTPSRTAPVELPPSYMGNIVPDTLRERLGHPDERIARRASTVANLAQIIRERDVSPGLRQTLLTQSERLVLLARGRLAQLRGATPTEESITEIQ